MTAPVLVPCLVALRDEFNRKYPHRDKGADGWIGDRAHQLESSDHNPDETGRTPYEDADHIDEVHALDVDRDVRDGDLTTDVEAIRLRHQRGRDDRLQNIIWRGQICSRSWGWTWREYTGASKHFDHAHFSARYTTAQESDTSPWGVLVNPPQEVEKMSDISVGSFNDAAEAELRTQATKGVWSYGEGGQGGLPQPGESAFIADRHDASGNVIHANALGYFRQLCNDTRNIANSVESIKAKLGIDPTV